VLAEIIAAVRRESLRPRRDPFYSLARSIVGQQISVMAAESVWRRFEATVGAVTPQAVLAAGESGLAGCGLSQRKMAYLVSLAEHMTDGHLKGLSARAWRGLDDEAVIERLTQVKGIGRWTAEMFLIFHMARPDVLPLGDIGVQRAVAERYRDGVRLDSDDIRAIAEPWRPWRSVAVWYLWRSLDAVPVEY
jgi:DNA-3-methyladenine glycosylase II